MMALDIHSPLQVPSVTARETQARKPLCGYMPIPIAGTEFHSSTIEPNRLLTDHAHMLS